MDNKLRFRYVFGIDGKPETYFFKVLNIEDIEAFHPLVNLSDEQIKEGYKIISRDQFTGKKDKRDSDIFVNDYVNYGDNYESLVIFDEYAVGETPGFWLREDGKGADFETHYPRFHTMIAYTTEIEIVGNIYGVRI